MRFPCEKGCFIIPNRRDKIRKRKDGRWEGRYFKDRKPDGTIRYASVYAASYQEVKEKLRLINENPENKNSKSAKKLTVSEVGSFWLKEKSSEVKPATILKYEFMQKKHINPVLGDLSISDMTPEVIRNFMQEKLSFGKLDGKGMLSPSYVCSMLVVLEEIHQYAVREKLCRPFSGEINKPALPERQHPVLDAAEVTRLEAELRNNITTVNLGILLTLYTGLRIGEVCALQWGDIDLDRRILTVRQTVQRIKKQNGSYLSLGPPKTKHSLRSVPIYETLLPLMKEMKQGDEIFVATGTASFLNPATCQYHFHKILKAAGLPEIRYHALRHTFATFCVAAEIDMKTLSQILGHTNTRFTLDVYTHPSHQQMLTEISKLGKALKSSKT